MHSGKSQNEKQWNEWTLSIIETYYTRDKFSIALSVMLNRFPFFFILSTVIYEE